jgi:hypothetical protein
MIFWLVLKLEINYRVMISSKILVSFREFFWRYCFCMVKYLIYYFFCLKILLNVNGKVKMWHTACFPCNMCNMCLCLCGEWEWKIGRGCESFDVDFNLLWCHGFYLFICFYLLGSPLVWGVHLFITLGWWGFEGCHQNKHEW